LAVGQLATVAAPVNLAATRQKALATGAIAAFRVSPQRGMKTCSRRAG
jgi:hypothetical protein